MKKLNLSNKGFTLVETLLVVIVLALIGLGGYWVYSNQDGRNQNTAVEAPADAPDTAPEKDRQEEEQLTEEEQDRQYCQKVTSSVPDSAIIHFGGDSVTALDDPSKDIALEFIDYLNCKSAYGDDPATATVYGHAASTGQPAVELELSRQRAEAVAQYMIDQGVSEELINVEAKGSTEPVATNSTPEGRAQNRRTVVSID